MTYLEIMEQSCENGKAIKVTLDAKVYSKATLLKSTYKFTDKAYIYIQTKERTVDTGYIVYFKEKDQNSLGDILDQFMNELLDQELRQIVLLETKQVRDTIVARALLSGQNNE